jgi:DNA-binding transcriptional LysR family regulator
MEFYHLRTFLTVADEGHLTRAAEKLMTSQPAVSAQLRALEEEVGMKLFERTSKGMVLTASGRALQEHARRIVEAAKDFKSQADALRDHVSGELVLGLNNRPEILRLMEILGDLTQRHPDLNYEMVCGSSGVILQGLEEGSISIGFFEGECEDPRVAFEKLDTIELCLAAPAAWAEELAEPDWKKLESKPWIFVSRMCSYCRAIESIFREQGMKVTPRFRVNEELTVLNLVADGLGLTLVARSQLEAPGFEGRIVALPHFRATVPLNIGWLASRTEDPAIAAVREAVLRIWQSPRKSPPFVPSPPALSSSSSSSEKPPRSRPALRRTPLPPNRRRL